MPSPLPLEKQVEKRIRDMLTKDYEGMTDDNRLEALKMGIAWVKATKGAKEDAFGSFFTDKDIGDES